MGFEPYDDVSGLLNDALRDALEKSLSSQGAGICEGPDVNAKKLYKLVEDAQEELYA